MNLDQLIREVEPEFRRHVVDKGAFKGRLFEVIDGGMIRKKRRFFTWKKNIVLPMIVAVPLFGTVAGAAVYKWHTTWNSNMQATNGDATNAAVFYIPPYWESGYLYSLPQSSSIIDLQTSIAEADFPIREPSSVPGWTNVLSEGYFEGKTKVLKYLDVYQGPNGERVSVLQQNSGPPSLSQQDILPYPQDAQQLADFSPDLAVYVSGPVDGQTQNTANELDIYHKNGVNTVTEFQIAGMVSEQTLEMIAKAYLQAPSK